MGEGGRRQGRDLKAEGLVCNLLQEWVDPSVFKISGTGELAERVRQPGEDRYPRTAWGGQKDRNNWLYRRGWGKHTGRSYPSGKEGFNCRQWG